MTFGMRPILTSRWNEKRYLAGSETGVEQKASQPAPRSFTFSRRAAPPAAAGRTCLRASCPDLSRCAEGSHSSGGFAPVSLPLFQGTRFGADVRWVSWSCMVMLLGY